MASGGTFSILMNSLRKRIVAGTAALSISVIVFFTLFVFSIIPFTVMTKRSPDGKHTAKLARAKGIDLNFWVSVDGQKIYHSPDFAPTNADFREQIVWSMDSQSVILLVAETRLFGYHVKEERALTDSELFEVRLPELKELGFEGTVPIDSEVK